MDNKEKITRMNWLVDLLEGLFRSTFGILKVAENGPWIVFWSLIVFGLIYWLRCQQKYNKQADADPNQLK